MNTEAKNRGRELEGVGEPAELSGEAAAVKGKLGGTAQAGEERDQLVGASGSNGESGEWSQRRDAADDDEQTRRLGWGAWQSLTAEVRRQQAAAILVAPVVVAVRAARAVVAQAAATRGSLIVHSATVVRILGQAAAATIRLGLEVAMGN